MNKTQVLDSIQVQITDMMEYYMEKHDLSKQEFAKLIGFSENYVYQVLAFKKVPKMEDLVEISLRCGHQPIFWFKPMEQAEVKKMKIA